MWDYTKWVIPELKNYNSKHLKWKKGGGGKSSFILIYYINENNIRCFPYNTFNVNIKACVRLKILQNSPVKGGVGDTLICSTIIARFQLL